VLDSRTGERGLFADAMIHSEDLHARPARRLQPWLGRLAGSALAFGLIFAVFPPGEVFASMAGVDPVVLTAALGGFLLCHVITAVKWRLFIAPDGEIGLAAAVKSHFAGLAASLFLPGLVGGDVIRAGILMRGGRGRTKIAIGSFAERAVDTLGLLLISGVGAASAAVDGARLAMPLVGAGLVGAVCLSGYAALQWAAPRIGGGRLDRTARRLADAAETMARRPGLVAVGLALSMAVQLGFIGLTILLARSIGLDLPAVAWLFAWPLAKLIAAAPISFAGLGVREASLAGLLAPLGADPALVVATGLLWQTVFFAGAAIGGLAVAGRIARRGA